MTPENDPRVYFAAERTLLAWIRTALAIIGLGFVVARFGMFLQILTGNPVHHLTTGNILGLLMIAIGAISLFISAWQHLRFTRALPASERPDTWVVGYAIGLAVSLSVVSLLLAIYLAVSPHEAAASTHKNADSQGQTSGQLP